MNGRRTWVLGVLVFTIVTAGILAILHVESPDRLPRCLESTLIAFETAESPSELNDIWQQFHTDQKKNLHHNLWADFGFMIGYGTLFVLLGLLGCERHQGIGHIASTLAIATAIVTVGFDVGENTSALRLLPQLATLNSLPPDAADVVAAMRRFSLGKWALCGVTLILLWWAYVPAKRGPALYRLLSWTVAWFSLISGVLVVWGLFYTPRIELVLPFLSPALIGQVILFWRYYDTHMGRQAPAYPALENWQRPNA